MFRTDLSGPWTAMGHISVRQGPGNTPFWRHPYPLVIGGVEAVVLLSEILLYALLFKIMDFLELIISYEEFWGRGREGVMRQSRDATASGLWPNDSFKEIQAGERLPDSIASPTQNPNLIRSLETQAPSSAAESLWSLEPTCVNLGTTGAWLN